jgi:hypothetical protein
MGSVGMLIVSVLADISKTRMIVSVLTRRAHPSAGTFAENPSREDRFWFRRRPKDALYSGTRPGTTGEGKVSR